MNFPASRLRPVSGQLRGYAGVVHDAVFPTENAVGNNRPEEDREDMPAPGPPGPPVEYTAAQGQPQNLGYLDMPVGYYDIANDHPPLHGHRNHGINNNAGAALDVPAQAQAALPDPEIDIFVDPALNAAAGPARALLDEWPHHNRAVPNADVNELLRQLAILYLRDPNSQITVIRMEPGPDQVHGVRVHITLDLL